MRLRLGKGRETDRLGVRLLLRLGDARLLEELLPFLGQARDWVGRSGDSAPGAVHAAGWRRGPRHKGGAMDGHARSSRTPPILSPRRDQQRRQRGWERSRWRHLAIPRPMPPMRARAKPESRGEGTRAGAGARALVASPTALGLGMCSPASSIQAGNDEGYGAKRAGPPFAPAVEPSLPQGCAHGASQQKRPSRKETHTLPCHC